MMNEINEASYPEAFRNMPRPPSRLYIRGVLPDPSIYKYLCVVGSRIVSPYGKDVITKIMQGLRGYPICIVSGLAIGVDSLAHKAALEAGLPCVAFPGSSLVWEKIYPYCHRGLAEKIVSEGGALLSEFPPEFETTSWAFPARNRLMAGMSKATLIVEAKLGSGSLMTAKYAEDFDRDLLAVPGSIYSDHSYGPHMLIKRGAALVDSAEDVVLALGLDPKKKTYYANTEKNKLTDIQKEILNIIAAGSITIDDLVTKTEIKHSKLLTILSELELYKYITIDNQDLRLC